jgi:hypothetical protein
MAMQHAVGGASLADILERILDKGIVVAGDVAISLVGVELLTVRIRLVVCSVDRALELGIRWWESDAALSGAPPHETAQLRAENMALLERVKRLEQSIGAPVAA